MALTAAETQKLSRFLNPWALHLQKLGLELKCPSCLNLLNKPMLLPCDHIFCKGCIPKAEDFGSECPACKHHFDDGEFRPAPYIENIVTIYRSLDATFSNTMLQPSSSDAGMAPELSPVTSTKTIVDKSRMELTQNPHERNIRNGKSDVLLLAVDKHNNNAGIGKKIVSTKNKAKKSVLLGGALKEEVETGSNSENQFGRFQQVGNADALQTEEIDMNHVPQLSPGTSNSFSDPKETSGKRCDPLSKNESVERRNIRKAVEDKLDTAGNENNRKATCDDTFQARDTKRQKKLSYESAEIGAQSYDHTKQEPCTDGTSERPCAFCHSSKFTEGSGPMLYYANGKEVVRDNLSNFSNVIPVHTKCIEWTPQVYFKGDNIKNLESELARAAKLKCSSCGIKGAALGCFAKSCRRTYHVPCAYDIEDCRWDCEDFLVLCPSHNKVKFPREKSNRVKTPGEKIKPETCSSSEKYLVSDQTLSKGSNFWASSPDGQKEWVLCGSALSSEDKYILDKFASMCGATVTKNWKPNVTHIVASTDANGACSRTLKFLMAILHGKWILTMDWVKACMETNGPQNEEFYEVGRDNHGCYDGPKTGRLRVATNAPKLFEGLRFYFSGDFVLGYKRDLLNLVQTAGGVIIESKEKLMAESPVPEANSSSSIIVYNRDPPQGCPYGEEGAIVLKRLAEAEDLAKVTRFQVVRHTWVLESIAACKLLPFLC